MSLNFSDKNARYSLLKYGCFYLGIEHASAMITLSSSRRLLHISCNLGSSQLSSSKTLMRALAPYCNLSYLGNNRLLFPLGYRFGHCKISKAEQNGGSQGETSMYSSSDMPNLQRKCSKIGSVTYVGTIIQSNVNV